MRGMTGADRRSGVMGELAAACAAADRRIRNVTGVEARARARELAVLTQVGRTVNAPLEMPLIVRAVARELYRVVPFKKMNLAFYEADSDTIVQHHVVAGNWDTVLPPLGLAAAKTVSIRAIQERRTIYSPDLRLSDVPRHAEVLREGTFA